MSRQPDLEYLGDSNLSIEQAAVNFANCLTMADLDRIRDANVLLPMQLYHLAVVMEVVVKTTIKAVNKKEAGQCS